MIRFLWIFAAAGLLARPAGETKRPTPGGILAEFNFASFAGAGQTSIQATAIDPSGNLYVTGTTTAPDLPTLNAAQPAFGESLILRSSDSGVTWHGLGRPAPDINLVAPDAASPQVVFATGTAGIFKTTDGGQTWRSVYTFHAGVPGALAGGLVVDAGNHLRLACTAPNTGLVRSFDNGETWSAPVPNILGSLIADPGGSGALVTGSLGAGYQLSRDWGATFQRLTPPGPGSTSAVAFDPSHPGWIYADVSAGTLGNLWLSVDYGATWTQKASPPSTFTGIQNLAVDPTTSTTLTAATPDGVWKSTDGAASWVRTSGPGSAFLVNTFVPFALVSGGIFATGSGAGPTYSVAFSPDYGATWQSPQLSGVTSVSAGPNGTAYVTRTASSDAFVAKLAPDGATLWATYLGGSDQDAPVALTLDRDGNLYVAGNTRSPDFPSTTPRIGVQGQVSVFVTRLSPAGAIQYSVVTGGEAISTATALAVDGEDNAYLAGRTESQQFPITPGVLVSKLDVGSYTGFLLKLSPAGNLTFATYLGTSYTYPSALAVDAAESPIVAGAALNSGSTPAFLLKLDRAASSITASGILIGTYASPLAGVATLDSQGNLYLALPTSPTAPLTGCAGNAFNSQYELYGNTELYVAKFSAGLTPIYTTAIAAPCGIQPGSLALDSSGSLTLGFSTGQGLALHTPLLGAPDCSYNSSAIARLTSDGSQVTYATYLDNCGPPAVAIAPDGALYAGVSPVRFNGAAGVLRLPPQSRPALALDQIANAFSGDINQIARGGLYTLTGSGFPAGTNDLTLSPSHDLPNTLGGIQVTFDGVAAPVLNTAPNRVTVAMPTRVFERGRIGARRLRYTAVQLIWNGATSNTVWMPIAASLPGLSATVLNPDGAVNDASHPAASGSTVTLFATGMGATNPPVWPGTVAQTTAVVPVTAVYSNLDNYGQPTRPVTTIPGYIAALFQVKVQVPSTAPASGTFSVGLLFALPSASGYKPPVSNTVSVWVK